MRTCILIVAAFLLLPVTAVAQNKHDDEALWLAFAPLFEQALEQVELGTAEGAAEYHSGAWLNQLAGEFADDPAYWQLRWWHTTTSQASRDDLVSEASRAGTLFLDEVTPDDWLRQAQDRGVVDFTLAALLYQAEAGDLQRLWNRHGAGEATPDDMAYLARFGFADKPWIAFEEAEAALIDALVAAYPEESWSNYERAMLHFEYGQWEAGLVALVAGNHAQSNRAPLSFPQRYLYARMNAGQPVANEVAAGAVWQMESIVPLPNFISIGDHARAQTVRWAMGAPLSEIGAWHRYLCRLGVTDGSLGLQTLIAATIHDRLMRYWLIESPGALERDQREAFFNLNRRLREPRNVFRHRPDGFDEWLTAAGEAVTSEEVYRASYAYAYQQQDLQSKAVAYFERAYNFDFETFSYPDLPTDTAE